MKRAIDPRDLRDLRARFTETDVRAGAKRWRVYKNGKLMAGSADEATAHRIAALIGQCEVKS